MMTIPDNAYFTVEELQCKCGCKRCDMNPDFMQRLIAFRIAYGQPMVITSGFRCNNYNTKIKGTKHSQHLVGNAVDVSMADPLERYKIVALATLKGFSLGIDGAFIHIDGRTGEKLLFLYNQ